MTRLELLKIVIGRARTNGFEFRRWYTQRLGLPWISAEAALALLETQRRYYALLFSHEFAQAFWKAGEEITFEVPASTFQRVRPDGTIATIRRKGFTRRSARKDVWRYHLSQMALAAEPLRYIRKYLAVAEDLSDGLDSAAPEDRTERQHVLGHSAQATTRTRTKPLRRALPEGLPPFLQRPYR